MNRRMKKRVIEGDIGRRGGRRGRDEKLDEDDDDEEERERERDLMVHFLGSGEE